MNRSLLLPPRPHRVKALAKPLHKENRKTAANSIALSGEIQRKGDRFHLLHVCVKLELAMAKLGLILKLVEMKQ